MIFVIITGVIILTMATIMLIVTIKDTIDENKAAQHKERS